MSALGEVMQLARKGPFRSADATRLGIPRPYLLRWLKQGVLERVGRGVYRLVEVEPTERATLAEVGSRVPRAVVCLLSALQFHDLTTESPAAVWLMIEGHSRTPKVDFVRTEVVRASGESFRHGIMAHAVEGVRLQVTSPAKTVADCFRYRRHVGLAVALDALRDYMRRVHARSGPQYSVRRLEEACEAARVMSVVRPYLEALV